MNDEKPEEPLRVGVARALGLNVVDKSRWCSGQCISAPTEDGCFPSPRERGRHYHERFLYWRAFPWENDGEWAPVEDYLTDWSATGPLIDKYKMHFEWTDCKQHEGCVPGWEAWNAETVLAGFSGFGATHLEAACELILSLKEDGKPCA